MSEDGAPEDELEDVDSGPFCRHFSDPVDCDVRCERCGHQCCQHQRFDPGSCEECDCAAFANPPEDETP